MKHVRWAYDYADLSVPIIALKLSNHSKRFVDPPYIPIMRSLYGGIAVVFAASKYYVNITLNGHIAGFVPQAHFDAPFNHHMRVEIAKTGNDFVQIRSRFNGVRALKGSYYVAIQLG